MGQWLLAQVAQGLLTLTYSYSWASNLGQKQGPPLHLERKARAPEEPVSKDINTEHIQKASKGAPFRGMERVLR